VERPHLEVVDVFRRFGSEYRLQHAGTLSRGQQRVMSAIERCRIEALGGHLEQCDARGNQAPRTTPAGIDGEPGDNARNGVVKFDNGVTGIVKANYRTGGRHHRREIHGSGASAYVDLGTGAGVDCAATIPTHQGAASYSLAAAGALHLQAEACRCIFSSYAYTSRPLGSGIARPSSRAVSIHSPITVSAFRSAS